MLNWLQLGDRLAHLYQLAEKQKWKISYDSKTANLRKECRHPAGWKRQNQGGAGELSRCGCMVIKKKYYNKQHTNIYQTTNSWVTEELRGWFYSWPLTTRYQQRNSTLSLLCQNTHRLAGRSILAEKWYLAVYGNRERKKRTSHHVCVCFCMCDTVMDHQTAGGGGVGVRMCVYAWWVRLSINIRTD